MKHTKLIKAIFLTGILFIFTLVAANAQIYSNTPASGPCDPPDNLHVQNLTTSTAELVWDDVNEASTGYMLRYRLEGTSTWLRIPSQNNSEIITGLTANTTYEAKVRSDCDGGYGDYGSIFTFTTLSTNSCSVPDVYFFSSDSITANSCVVGWRRISGGDSYNVRYRERFTTTAWMLGGNSTGRTLLLTGLDPQTQYEFQVQTVCASGTAPYSLSGIFTTPEGGCGSPGNLSASNITSTSATLRWNALSCADSYNVSYRLSGSSWTNASTSNTSLPVSNLDSGSTYEFRVISIDQSGSASSPSPIYSFTTSTSSCGTPDNLLVTSVTTDVAVLTWDVVPGSLSYTVRYRLAGALSWQTTSTLLNITTISGLSADNVYEFQVQSVCSSSPGSFSAMATFLTLPNITSGLPVPDHIVICIMENKSYSQIVNSSNAPHLNDFIDDPNSAVFHESYGLTHPSQPNYIRLFSGSTNGITSNTILSSHLNTPNLAKELINAGRTFVSYSEGLPSVGYDGTSSGNYRKRHNPIANWMGNGSNQVSSTLNKPYSSFPTGNYSSLPTVSFVIPDLINDMHDGSLGTAVSNGDDWFQSHMVPYMNWAKTHNSLLIFTMDEDDGSHGNQVLTVLNGQMTEGGLYSMPINHYNVLRTILEMYGCNFIGNAASASPISGCWINGFRMAAEQPSESDSTQATNTIPVDKLAITHTGWKIYPNPAFGEINADYELSDAAEVSIKVYNTAGAILSELKLGEIDKGRHTQNIPLDPSNFPAGIYFIEIKHGNDIYTQRFLISK